MKTNPFTPVEAKMRERSTNPNHVLRPDDRPIATRQDARTKRWEVVRQDHRPGGEKIVARDLSSREEAGYWAERERTLVPRTDRTRRGRTRSTFYGFNVPASMQGDAG